MIYSFWIFDKHCNCIFEREWTLGSNTNNPNVLSSGTINSKQNDEIGKLLYGMIFSLNSVTQKLSTSVSDNQINNNIRSISTGKFRIHTMQTATGLWFILITDFKQQNYSQVLHYIYSHIYIKYVVHNFLSPYDFALNPKEQRGQGVKKINNRHFINTLEAFLQPMLN